ncbi:hypothetical protein ACEWY4_023616 [Coilia grayii]|uniref:Uncharacterized protein n=1 Tax=Coilia grayii TaxID=363190 RepID=A0ABD1J3K3_9TELE
MVHKKRGAFDLNRCTMRQLMQLSGISHKSARKLVRFQARQQKKAKRMDAERQAHLKRRHDLMAELNEEAPSKLRRAQASPDPKKKSPSKRSDSVREVLSESVESSPTPHQKTSELPETLKSDFQRPDVNQNADLKGQCFRRSSVFQDDRFICSVCGAKERCWLACNQLFVVLGPRERKEECTKRRQKEKDENRHRENRNDSNRQCVLL